MNRTVQRLRPFAGAAARAIACAALLGAPLALHAADTAPAAGANVASAHAPYIVVDTGHTPAHPGSTGASGRVEYLYNLDLSGAIAKRLTADGDRVLRTSADGREIKLDQRSTQAPDADLFVSIHHDSMQQQFIDAGRQREFHGFAVFVSERNPHYEQSLRCAKAIAGKLIAAGETPSLYHAQPIRGENRPLIDAHLGIHRFDDLVVLRTAPIPAVLVEAGVIVNPDEEKRLAQPETIQRLSAAIAGGIEACTASE
ncbi:N-acetylmuramoyl-L-alanine amidase [Burkholderia sp. Ac-20353]|uniref:N-acetylmuramoyl-L-alanine amidase family protein n=1 Tax=Burkholderia sp. Ac-20353 TaxID=2703894 RepID=UPI00197C57B2|nr:N-acetylmuramoyl-L-alanine amidase [Burkholderia sp. Ac-20353]MBN3791152.1 N-acetylmuramoyl-L-alanine amidase [Burkholderia sp. Ac-20353]